MHHHTDRITHTSASVRPIVEHWLEREIAQRDLTMDLHLAPLEAGKTFFSHSCVV